jgi:multiple sugar transport system permease protein
MVGSNVLPTRSRSGNRNMDRVVTIALLLLALLWLFPFLWALLSSLKSAQELATGNMGLPRSPMWQNYADAFVRMNYLGSLRNSFIYAGGAALLQCVTGALAAYAFARIVFPARELLFMLVLATMMIPATVTLTANFVILQELGWINTFLALIVPHGASGFAIFLLRQFFMVIPKELEDAAWLDGAGRLRFLVHVALPLARPALATVFIFIFIQNYNAFLWPLVMTSSESLRVAQVSLTTFQDELGTGLQQGTLMAASILTLLPTVILFSFLQRAFIRGITQTGLK